MSTNQKYTVRLKVAFDDKVIADKVTYQVFYLRKKKTAIEKFDSNGCSKVYETYVNDIVWFEIYLSGKLIDKIFVTPTLNGKYNDNIYKIKTKQPLKIPVNNSKLRTVSFCEALDLFIKNPSVWTVDNPPDLYTREIGQEQDYIRSLGININTNDGVDLQYFLIQHRYRRTVDGFTGFLAWGGLNAYLIFFSGVSAINGKTGFAGYWQDVRNDFKGNTAGFAAGGITLGLYTKMYCGTVGRL
ncbi:hypothetical protein [Moraxella oblonga]|uniref:hypothetical protein n=1 Tax=Moraxella oblonga TaxID=200413 RepID=UPI00082CCC52|nr:hypothetical protein [Moraxella oblonga]